MGRLVQVRRAPLHPHLSCPGSGCCSAGLGWAQPCGEALVARPCSPLLSREAHTYTHNKEAQRPSAAPRHVGTGSSRPACPCFSRPGCSYIEPGPNEVPGTGNW